MKAHEIAPNQGATKRKRRVGRGISAGQGKTAGRGTKGYGARRGGGGKLYRQGGTPRRWRQAVSTGWQSAVLSQLALQARFRQHLPS